MGYKWREVGEQLDTTINGAVALYKRYIAIDLANEQEEQEIAKSQRRGKTKSLIQ